MLQVGIVQPHIHMKLHVEVLTFIDSFMVLLFKATGAPLAAKQIWILPLSHYIW
jgi:hypothetical protein